MGRSSVSAVLELAALDKHDWELALQRILRIDCHVLQVDRASYWNVDAKDRSITCELGYVDSADALERGAVLGDRDAHAYLEALDHAKVIDVEDVERDPRTVQLLPYCRSRRIRALLDIPVWVQSRLAGVVCQEHIDSARQWTEAEVDFALSVAQVIATALEARARSRAEEQERQSTFLAHVSMALSQSLDEHLVAERAVSAALPMLADWAAIDRFGERCVERIAIAHYDPSKRAVLSDYTKRFPPSPTTAHMTVQAHRIHQAAVVSDVTDDLLRATGFSEEHIEALRRIGIKSAIAVPFRTESGGDMVLQLISAHRTYRYESLKLAERYVECVAAAMHNACVYRVAEEALRARDEFLAMAAHELRTPLTSLRTSCERLAALTAHDEKDELTDVGARVLRQSRRLTRLVNRMLDASSASGTLPLVVPEPVDLVPIIRDVADELGAARSGVRIDLELPPALIGLWDGERVRQAITTLVENALEYGAGKPITIAAAADRGAGEARITVIDHGIGIDADVLPHVFEPYIRGVSGRRYGGLGLGLYLARHVAEAHHGSIDVESEQGQGSAFTLRLPLDAAVTC